MANCLVTKLKEVVNDVDIPVLGDMIIKLKKNEDWPLQNRFSVTNNITPITIKVLKGTLFEDSTCSVPIVGDIVVSSDFAIKDLFFNTSSSGVTISMNKYSFYGINAPCVTSFNLEDIWYSTYTKLVIDSCKEIVGDIEPTIEHACEIVVKNNRTIDPNYPIAWVVLNTGLKFHGSTFNGISWGLTMLRDGLNDKLFNIYAYETVSPASSDPAPTEQQFQRLAGTYNTETKVWTYTDLF